MNEHHKIKGRFQLNQFKFPVVTTFLLLSFLCLALVFPKRLNYDVAQLLHEGMLLTQGKLPYADFYENNPPLIIYLSSLPVFVSAIAKINLVLTAQILLALLVIWSVLSVNSILQQTSGTGERFESNFLVAVWAAFSLWIWFRMEFGQKEHLFVLMYVPYLLLRFFKWQGLIFSNWKCISFGVAAGIGACIKPHFLFITILPELYWVATTRDWRKLFTVETIAFSFTGLIYGFHFMLLPETVLDAYSKIISLNLKHYKVYNCSALELLTKNSMIFSAVVVIFSLLIENKHRSFLSPLIRPLSILIGSACFIFFLQRKGFGYHSIPAQAFCVLLFGIISGHACGELFRKRSFNAQIFDTHIDGKCIKKILLCVLPLLGIVVSVLSVRNILSWHAQLESDDIVSKTIISHSLPGEPVLVITTSVPEVYPTVLLLGCQQGSRYLYGPHFAYFSSMYSESGGDYFQYWARDGSQQPEIAFLQELEIDILKFRPRLIMVRTGSCYACAADFDIMKFLDKIGFIRHAMADYKLISEPNAKFAVFSRIGGNLNGDHK